MTSSRRWGPEDAPVPKPPAKKLGVEKKPFVPHPHLSSSPLRDNEGLKALRDQLHNQTKSN